VTYPGWSGWQDWNLMPEIHDGGFTFGTNNVSDFRRLYAQAKIHEGLVIVIPNGSQSVQRQLFAAALDALDEAPGLINEALEVEVVDGEVQVNRHDLPPETGGRSVEGQGGFTTRSWQPDPLEGFANKRETEIVELRLPESFPAWPPRISTP
jgi:hypothetical protein